MPLRRRAPKLELHGVRDRTAKTPGGPPLSAKRELYIALVAQGMNNSAACRTIGISRKTGYRWDKGRTVVTQSGPVRTYPSITRPPATPPRLVSARFLSEVERLTIADGLVSRRSLRSIAAELGRSPSTISREVAQNSEPVTGHYRPHGAQCQAEQRRCRLRPAKFVANLELAGFVQGCLEKRWSPEQVSKALPETLPEQPDMRVCHETIYQALYNPDRGGLRRELTKRLRTGRVRRKRRPDERRSRFGGAMTMISARPKEVADRKVPGHWEGDLIMGAGNHSAIGTLVERTTRFVELVHLPTGHSGKKMTAALTKKMSVLPAHLARSLTWDQGSEMSDHLELTAATGVDVYFCQPASPLLTGQCDD